MTRVTPDGTPECAWEQWWHDEEPVAALDLTELSAAARVVVLAAHPDDELLAVGGLCRRLYDEGVPLWFVWASDGGAAFDGVAEVTGVDRDGLPALRRAEALGGLTALGVMPSPTQFLELPDGELPEHEAELQRALDDAISDTDVLLAPWSHDRHPDHETCGRVASRTRAGHVLQYPVWLWHWATPAAPGVPWQRMRGVVLSAQEVAAKAAAVAEHHSQVTAVAATPGLGAVLPPSVLAYFRRSVEVVFA